MKTFAFENINKSYNIDAIYPNNCREAFAALKYDETVITWGKENYGGNSASVQHQLNHVKMIYSTEYGFTALKEDGTEVKWGRL